MPPRQAYIVLPTTHSGGTQHRLIALWDYCQSRGVAGVYLVLTERLFASLAPDENLPHLKVPHPFLIVLKARRFRDMIAPLFFIARRAGRNAVFHYPLTSLRFFHTLFGQRVIRSIPMSDLSMLLAERYKALQYYQLIRSHRIDVLNPRVVDQLRRHWLLGRLATRKVRLTRGNSIWIPPPVDLAGKRNWIVFLGRFTDQANDVKNVLRYVDFLPAVWAALASLCRTGLRFLVLGYGPLEAGIQARLRRAEYAGLPVECRFEPRPETVLRQSKVFLSLQKFTNYPSRSLLEAMAHGNLPVITDAGESRLLAPPDCAEFIPERFSAENLSRAILRLLSVPEADYRRRVEAMRTHVAEAFSMEAHLRYYLELYGRGIDDK